VLDEVDAALDNVNVRKVCHYIKYVSTLPYPGRGERREGGKEKRLLSFLVLEGRLPRPDLTFFLVVFP